MGETRKLAAILVADVVGYSRLAAADEDRTLARLRGLRSDLIDPAIAAHHGRIVKRTGDGNIIEFRSVVDAVRCAIEVQSGLVERNAGVPEDRRIEFRVGIHLGDVVEESDGDLMGDGVNIAARLEGIAQPGEVCLSEDAYRQVREKLKYGFVNLGQKTLKNIARPIGVYALKPGSESAAPAQSASASNTPGPPHFSIVVLPFANMSGDPEQEYFVDGVTESLTTDLSRISGSFVIGRSTAFTYKGKPIDLKQIGRELNVRYVLEGSVQRGGSRMRVNVQLIDAETGSHLWAERFDKPLADLFDMQDDIVARLAGALDAELAAAEARRAEQAPNPDSMDLYFQGIAWLNKGLIPTNVAQARLFRSRACRRPPQARRRTFCRTDCKLDSLSPGIIIGVEQCAGARTDVGKWLRASRAICGWIWLTPARIKFDPRTFRVLSPFCHRLRRKSVPEPICEGFPAMAKQTAEQFAEASAEVLTKSSEAADTAMSDTAAALTENGNASRAAIQQLTRAYQELATKNVNKLTAAMRTLATVRSPAEFIDIQQRLIKEGFETAISDSQQITLLTTAVFTAAFEPTKKQAAGQHIGRQ